MYPPQSSEILRIDRFTPEQLAQEFVAKQRPVVLTGVTDHWLARAWTPAYLKDVCGDVDVTIRGGRGSRIPIADLPLAAYIDWLQWHSEGGSAPACKPNVLWDYDRAHAVKPIVGYSKALRSRLAADVDFAPLCPTGYRSSQVTFWISCAGSITPMHYDTWGINLFAQIYGRKRFVLADQSQSRRLYPSQVYDPQMAVFSRVDIDSPDHKKFPDYRRARTIEVTLSPGEVLLLPRNLWHDVTSLDASISVNAWIGTPLDYSRFSPIVNQERLKRWLHRLGVYARGQCLCHRVKPDQPARLDLAPIHGRELADLLARA